MRKKNFLLLVLQLETIWKIISSRNLVRMYAFLVKSIFIHFLQFSILQIFGFILFVFFPTDFLFKWFIFCFVYDVLWEFCYMIGSFISYYHQLFLYFHFLADDRMTYFAVKYFAQITMSIRRYLNVVGNSKAFIAYESNQ